MIKIYGIKNCDTMKKAMKWLQDNNYEFVLHDYKKDGVPLELMEQALDQCGWDTVLNQRGTTWRQLPDDTKNAMDNDSALDVAMNNPSIIKRPMIHHKGQFYFGFKADLYDTIL